MKLPLDFRPITVNPYGVTRAVLSYLPLCITVDATPRGTSFMYTAAYMDMICGPQTMEFMCRLTVTRAAPYSWSCLNWQDTTYEIEFRAMLGSWDCSYLASRTFFDELIFCACYCIFVSVGSGTPDRSL